MNNKEFIEKVSQKTNFYVADVKHFTEALIDSVVESVANGGSLTVQGFGTFEPREKAKRKIFNPATKEFVIVEPKTTLAFKMSTTLKERINM